LAPEQRLDPTGIRGGKARDGERAPMPWSSAANAGFTSGTPWLPLADDVQVNNVAAQQADPRSMLSLYRALIALRKSELVLRTGDYQAMPQGDNVLVYERQLHGRRLSILLNFGAREQLVTMAHPGPILLSTEMDRQEHVCGAVRLRPNEGIVVAAEREA
jgi:alpha-glucosidase